jgi:iron(III) transport system ATP-binding protein
LQGVLKRYGRGASAHVALAGVSLEVAQGEFVALLGPSGSGKTSLLRSIAGLERIDAGRILIGEDCVADRGHHVPPERRNVGVVFQSHALWPHMTVFENVAFPLREARVPAAELEYRTREALAQVDLAALSHRRPSELSGGQKQRVSLARALVARPRVILFDEPLASLDVELRRDMMRHIAQLRSPDNTMVYVTHNQDEALGLADRIAVLYEGRIEQIASPEQLCREPQTARVAAFMGHGNLLQAHSLGPAGAGLRVGLGSLQITARCREPRAAGEPVELAVSTQSLREAAAHEPSLPATVTHVFFQGLSGHLVEARLAVEPGDPQPVQLVLPSDRHPRVGELLRLTVDDAWVIPAVAT